MANKKVEIIIIPPGQDSLNFSLARWVLWTAFGLGLVGLLTVILAFVSLGYLAEQVQTVKSLEREIQKFVYERQKIVVLEEELQHTRSKLNQILYIMGDVDTTSSGSGSSGAGDPLMALSTRNMIESGMELSSPELTGALYTSLDAQRFMPSIWPTQGIISQHFHWGEGYGKKHAGLDIATAMGNSIVAAADGQVVMADWDTALGHTVMIDHKNGYSTLYGHNSRLLVSNGVMVKRGQTIALSGNSGRSSAPHLHYEVRKNGAPIDPMKFLTN